MIPLLSLDVKTKKCRDEVTLGSTEGSYILPKHANPHDGFLSVNGITTVVINSRKPKARQVTAWLIHDVLPRGFNKIIEEKQQVIEGHQLAIEENQAALALLNNDLAAEREQKAELQPRYVPHRIPIDTFLCVLDTNDPHERGRAGRHNHYMIRCQRKQLTARLNTLRVRYPDMAVREPECDDPNAVHAWCRFKDDVLGTDNFYRNHFT